MGLGRTLFGIILLSICWVEVSTAKTKYDSKFIGTFKETNTKFDYKNGTIKNVNRNTTLVLKKNGLNNLTMIHDLCMIAQIDKIIFDGKPKSTIYQNQKTAFPQSYPITVTTKAVNLKHFKTVVNVSVLMRQFTFVMKLPKPNTVTVAMTESGSSMVQFTTFVRK